MIRREPFRQLLVGSWRPEGRAGGGLPATLELWGTRPLLLPGLGRSIAVEGVLDAKGLCERLPVRGRVTFDRWTPLAAAYDLELTLGDGTAGRLHAARGRELRGFFSAQSSVSADLVDAGGRCLAKLELRFDYRRDLFRYLT
ncbi:MAG: hypothetical protein IPM35_00565 [Myxococcales bacterium]|nr:hypothetical protein [Myxococcales bacterium]